MKAMICLLAGSLLVGFTKPADDEIDGIWIGYYRTDLVKEKLVVKFNNQDKIEFYTGGVDEKTRCDGTYRLLGDSVSFTYRTAEGEEFLLQGHINRRKNFLDGIWKTKDKTTGSFYLEKQKLEEFYAKP